MRVKSGKPTLSLLLHSLKPSPRFTLFFPQPTQSCVISNPGLINVFFPRGKWGNYLGGYFLPSWIGCSDVLKIYFFFFLFFFFLTTISLFVFFVFFVFFDLRGFLVFILFIILLLLLLCFYLQNSQQISNPVTYIIK